MGDSNAQARLVSLASRKRTATYDELMKELQIGSERELENLIIQSIYQDVVQARLNPKDKKVVFTDWSSSKAVDLDLEFMENTLSEWTEHCQSFIVTLENEAGRSNEVLTGEAQREKKIEEQVERIKKNLATSGKLGKNDASLMDVGGSRGGGGKNEAKRHKSAMRNFMKRNN
ncbi:COP9 signalosome complex subunit 7b [Ditylenchus destructor]|nr:COP9 signalosome complex subunit 7b [Ditylenchus destructor]